MEAAVLEVMGTDGRVCVLNIFYGQYKAGTDDLQYKKYYICQIHAYTLYMYIHVRICIHVQVYVAHVHANRVPY